MKNIFYNLLIISILSIIFCSCETVTNDVITAGDKPVIEAYLVPNQAVNMHITKEIPYTVNDSVAAEPINNLSITIKDETGKTFLLKSSSGGIYKSASSEKIIAGKTYSLSFTYNGRTISASTTVPLKPAKFAIDKTSITRTQIDLSNGSFTGGSVSQDDASPVTARWTNPTSDYYFIAVDNLEPVPVSVIILPNTTEGNDIQRITRRFRQQPVQGESNELRPQSFQYFGKHRIILYKVLPDYAALYKSNGTTSQNITTPPSIISNGLGLFTGVNADTVVFVVNKR
jgi:hypothetical protein